MPQGIKHIIVEVRHWEAILLFAPVTLVISYWFKQCHTDNRRAKNNSFSSSYPWLATSHPWKKYHQYFCQQKRTKVIFSLTFLNTVVIQNTSSLCLWKRHLLCNIQIMINIFYVYDSLIYIHICPARCNTKQSIYYSASSLCIHFIITNLCTYMFV